MRSYGSCRQSQISVAPRFRQNVLDDFGLSVKILFGLYYIPTFEYTPYFYDRIQIDPTFFNGLDHRLYRSGPALTHAMLFVLF